MIPTAFKILVLIYFAIDTVGLFAKEESRKYVRYSKLLCWLAFFVLFVIYK